MPAHLPELLREHQTAHGGRKVPGAVSRDRLRTLEFSNTKVIRSVHTGGVAALDLEAGEQRYLLAGAGDGSIAVYDTQVPTSAAERGSQEQAREAAGAAAALSSNARFLRASQQVSAAAANAEHTEHAALFSITKQTPGAHKYSVTAVAWYPIDSGMFVSGGFDSCVKVWDTNTQGVVCSFSLAARVYAAAMSPLATSHCLVAVGSGDTQVMLCDIVSGGFTHTLSGHRAAVWGVAWSPSSEWQVVTGGCDGQLRLWDIRRSGPLHIFDEHDTQQQRQQRRQQQQQQEEQQRNEQQQQQQQGEGREGRQRQQDAQNPSGPRAGRSSSTGSQRKASGSGSGRQRSLPRSSPGVAGSSSSGTAAAAAAAAVAAAAAHGGAGSEKMFLPERVTKYNTAHAGSITGVVPTPDGLHWLSAGTDDRVRLWDAASYSHSLVHYQGAYNRASRARQLAVSDDSTTLFHPSGNVVQMYDIASGRLLRTLAGGHFDCVNSIRWNPSFQELYSGSDDCNIVVWGPAPERTTAERDEGQAGSDGDAWSQ